MLLEVLSVADKKSLNWYVKISSLVHLKLLYFWKSTAHAQQFIANRSAGKGDHGKGCR
ncbi:hypothetical protein LYNGBM3L_51160 [Moorena producens 3L]|uniref:Uncharacterized protein n=1 Tax=Moorena producens 3L TaxID=489825 RepID=F4XYG2_9CYAN|nr:hypothetical protein LYNGBM3L_51160 [Moorena producens 3L]